MQVDAIPELLHVGLHGGGQSHLAQRLDALLPETTVPRERDDLALEGKRNGGLPNRREDELLHRVGHDGSSNTRGLLIPGCCVHLSNEQHRVGLHQGTYEPGSHTITSECRREGVTFIRRSRKKASEPQKKVYEPQMRSPLQGYLAHKKVYEP